MKTNSVSIPLPRGGVHPHAKMDSLGYKPHENPIIRQIENAAIAKEITWTTTEPAPPTSPSGGTFSFESDGTGRHDLVTKMRRLQRGLDRYFFDGDEDDEN